jgi:cyanosortase A-associated protein
MRSVEEKNLWLLQGLSLLLLVSILKLLVIPPLDGRRPSPEIFPDQWVDSSYHQWQLILPPANRLPGAVSQHTYNQVLAYQQYQRISDPTVTLTLYYVTNTAADMGPLLAAYDLPMNDEVQAFQDYPSPQGTYRLFAANSAVHLVSCLNPQGPATVTMTAFEHNRHFYDLRWSRILPWLSGRTPLFDRRCLWVQLSLAASQRTAETDEILKTHWIAVSTWWQARFPVP